VVANNSVSNKGSVNAAYNANVNRQSNGSGKDDGINPNKTFDFHPNTMKNLI
jgi:hypothetical protein